MAKVELPSQEQQSFYSWGAKQLRTSLKEKKKPEFTSSIVQRFSVGLLGEATVLFVPLFIAAIYLDLHNHSLVGNLIILGFVMSCAIWFVETIRAVALLQKLEGTRDGDFKPKQQLLHLLLAMLPLVYSVFLVIAGVLRSVDGFSLSSVLTGLVAIGCGIAFYRYAKLYQELIIRINTGDFHRII